MDLRHIPASQEAWGPEQGVPDTAQGHVRLQFLDRLEWFSLCVLLRSLTVLDVGQETG